MPGPGRPPYRRTFRMVADAGTVWLVDETFGALPRGPDLPERVRPQEPERTVVLTDPRVTVRAYLLPRENFSSSPDVRSQAQCGVKGAAGRRASRPLAVRRQE
ncbi:hypothetical protein CO676_33540 [Sinorhizobium sp. BJ1]|nr:hypothetical protein CO676_33540 [Sinorhizobium sp. BJ1]